MSAASYLAKGGFNVTILEKTAVLAAVRASLKPKVLPLIWDQAGIGCPMCLKDILISSVKK